jgi:hypothetical protein
VKFALLIHSDQASWADIDDDEKARLRAETMPKWLELFEELGKADPNVSGKELDEGVTAKVVRVVDGGRVVTDGPFAETKEVLGGAFFVDVAGLEEAIRLAALIPTAEYGSIEIRPLAGQPAEVAS